MINDRLENSETNHQAIIEYKSNWYFIYHSGDLPGGGTYRRSVCIDKLEYNSDGTIKKVVRTKTGVPRIISTGTQSRSGENFRLIDKFESHRKFSLFDLQGEWADC